VAAVQPERCLGETFEQLATLCPGLSPLASHDRILVVGAGKAGASMSRALEQLLDRHQIDLRRVSGLVNVPNETVTTLRAIRLHPARPAGTNQPTEAALQGTQAILQLVAGAGPNDLLICLISGGGSALLPAPVEGLTLADKQRVTELLHRCGATIQEMNTVRKHLSQVKGGGLARHFRGRRILSLIISDVIGDPLDVIASGPTCVDPTTFTDALQVLEKFQLMDQVPPAVLTYLRRGAAGQAPETLKQWPVDEQGQPIIHNLVVANNQRALAAAERRAEVLGYRVMNLSSFIDGETQPVAGVMAAIARGQARRGEGVKACTCILSGGETTVTLPKDHGLGGRNQEFVLACLHKLGKEHLAGITILSGGTDGEDGPTDAAGAIGDAELLAAAEANGLAPADYLARHDAYHFFQPLGGLLQTGLTETNVMDLRVILVTN
jgi:hydroxypyruvate reductase/glycerate 2-kinase